MTVFLCGFMGCGKTTIGKILAEKLKSDYIDMDEYIVEKENMSIPSIFEQKGEEYFRKKESEAVSELSLLNAVISCGGGAMINNKNAAVAAEKGVTIFLDVPFEVCYSRIFSDTNRPIVQNNSKEQLEEIYRYRYEIYKKNSVFSVNADTTPEEAAENIRKLLNE